MNMKDFVVWDLIVFIKLRFTSIVLQILILNFVKII